MLCGLNIKMNGYEEKFHDQKPSDQTVADYIAAYIKPGIDRIKFIERSSRLAEARYRRQRGGATATQARKYLNPNGPLTTPQHD